MRQQNFKCYSLTDEKVKGKSEHRWIPFPVMVKGEIMCFYITLCVTLLPAVFGFMIVNPGLHNNVARINLRKTTI